MKMNSSTLRSIVFGLASFALAPFAAAANTVIDVMVVYTPTVSTAYSGDPTTRINQLFALTNQIYKDSGVNLELHLVKTVQVNYTDDNTDEAALNDITQAKAPAFSSIPSLRDQYKADMVILYRPLKQVQAACGIAWIGGNKTNGVFGANQKQYMYSTLAISTCPDFVTAHELGHNMGLAHSRKQDGTGGTFPYALGYGINGQFTTIMAYETEFGDPYSQQKILKFSSPSLTCKGVPCGVVKTDATKGADAVSTLIVTTPQIAEFYPGSATEGSKNDVDILKDKMNAAKTAADAAAAALDANKAAIVTKTAAQTAAKATLTSATSAATAAKTAYTAALNVSSTSAKNVAALKTKVDAAKTKYDASTVKTAAANKAAYDSAVAAYNAALTKAAADLAAAQALQSAAESATAALNSATSAYNAATTALNTEKGLTADLTAASASAKAAYTAALNAYNAAAKKAGYKL